MTSRQQTPERLIRFVAKSGFLSKDLWARHFFERGGKRWAQFVWRQLQTQGHFVKHPFEAFDDVVVLNRKNASVRSQLETEPVPATPALQIRHDTVLLDGILRAEKAGVIGYWQTEAELKKLVVADYKIETQGQLIKYPDLLIHTRAPLPDRTIAIEYERTLKTRKRYLQIMQAYASTRRIQGLVVIASNSCITKAIQDVMREVYFPEKRIPVSFCSEREWLDETPLVLSALTLKTQQATQKAG